VARDEYGQAVVGRCLVAVTRSTGGIPGWSRWLQMYVPFIASQGYAAELHTELQELLRRIRAITCTEPRRMLKYAPCPGCRAFALIETDGEWYIACQLCPRRLTRDEYRDHAESVLPGLANFALWMLVSGRAADSEADSIQPGVEVQPPVGYGGGDGNEILARPCAG
jgi:hypothetical protein